MSRYPQIIKKIIFSPAQTRGNIRFLVSIAILSVCALALNPAIGKLSKNFSKKPVSIRKPLKYFDISTLSSFKEGWKVKQATAPVKDLNTDEYVHLIFTNPKNNPSRTELYITYYSNPGDKVAHTPEVCARQGGAIVEKLSSITIDVPQLAPDYQEIMARFIIFKETKYYYADIYVFFVENKFKYTRGQVRWTVAKPGNRCTYFSKIETAAVFTDLKDKDKAIQTCIILLKEALPELLASHFPTNEQIRKP